jgi:plasmid maintenance system antidote protein VapI
MTVLQKEPIKALRWQGMSYKEISSKLGISKDTVKSFCRRNAIEAVTASKETKNKDYKEQCLQCLQCGKELNKIRSTKKFCSGTCRLAYHKTHRKPTAICAHCGVVFDNNGNSARKYCSAQCYFSSRFPDRYAEEVAV